MSATYLETNQNSNQPPSQFPSQTLSSSSPKTANTTNNSNVSNNNNTTGKKANRAVSEPLINVSNETLIQPSTASESESEATPVTPVAPVTPATSRGNQVVELVKANSNNIAKAQSQSQVENRPSSNRTLLAEQSRNDRDRSRNPNVSLPVDLLNKRSIRIFLELVKGCFGSRLPDEAILDAILRVAVIEDEKLASLFCADFAEPLYIPDEKESIEAILAKLASIKHPTSDEEETLALTPNTFNAVSGFSPNATNATNTNVFRANANTDKTTNTDNRERTYRVPISPLTLRVLINCQRSLTSYLYYRVDINALAAKILEKGNYNANQVITEIRNHFRSLQDQQIRVNHR